MRANVYLLLASLLREPPNQDRLDMLAAMQGDTTPLGRAVGNLASLAGKSAPGAINLEYHALFIGTGGGELQPYGSHYMSGFLHENPIERLRLDMSRAGIGMRKDVDVPEDHIAALCEMMAGMILGDFSEAATLDEQRDFFRAHLSAWAARFFRDLQTARSSVFYSAVGGLGIAFMDIEDAAFAML